MLFNSYVFIFVFLPVTLIGFYLIGWAGLSRVAVAWLIGASLFFYGWWEPAYLVLIALSVVFNYGMGLALSASRYARKLLLGIGVAFNLGLLGYYKYANFFVDNTNAMLGADWHLQTIILPLAISFFTFQQVAYQVDAYRREAGEHNFLNYCLFVVFFPQLIAGPIVHHKEMMPQFARRLSARLDHADLALGISIFTLGLAKKVLLADTIAQFSTPVFTAAEQGAALTFYEAWGGVLAYTFQIYFDFSGYTDMAIGLARMFGIRLPLNFNSPYKAINIIDFWRRWHITLSRFLRDYLYIPLGGNRRGPAQRHVNLMITMLLGGLWHGAGWTFVIWGGLHGSYLVINHAWRGLRARLGQDVRHSTFVGRCLGGGVTFLAVVVAWVFFRAETLPGATNMLTAMTGFNGVALPAAVADANAWLLQYGFSVGDLWHNDIGPWGSARERPQGILLLILFCIGCWLLPNTAQIFGRHQPALGFDAAPARLAWRNQLSWSVAMGFVLGATILGLGSATEFLYFQF